MAQIFQKRMTAVLEGEFVVFLIGMRVNRWWKIHKWLPIFFAMPRMLKELYQNPELGFLGAESYFGRTTLMLQYWRSVDHLMRYARAKDAEHLPAWREFNRKIGTLGDVGIWHETYIARPGTYENIYTNMPPFGLGRVGSLVEATGERQYARNRLQAASLPASRLPSDQRHAGELTTNLQ